MEAELARREMSGVGVLAGLSWAAGSAYDRMGRDYDPLTGHNSMWRGTTATILLRDRLDRVYSCGDYAVDAAAGGGSDPSADLLGEGLDQGDLDRMPRLPAGLVVRDDVDGSPGWRLDRWRVLTWSAGTTDGSVLPWHHAGPTRRRVRQQPLPDQLALWDQVGMPLGLLPPPDIVGGTARETITVLLLHGEHPITGRRTLVLGRPDTDGQWLWRLDLQAEFPLSTTPAVVAAPAPGGISVDEPPVPLRLRDTAVTSGDQGQGRM